MTRLTIIVLLVTLQSACGAVPRLFVDKDFTPASFAESVNHFVSLGEGAAIEELEGLGQDSETYKNGFLVKERIGWMCRVLFEGKTGHALRPPKFGVLEFLPPPSMLEKNWPQFPVAASGSSYFVLGEGYIWINGQSEFENAKAYIEYCRLNGVFRKQPVSVPTKARALKDLAALKASAPWKSIKWTYDFNGGTYTLSEKMVWTFLEGQANSIR